MKEDDKGNQPIASVRAEVAMQGGQEITKQSVDAAIKKRYFKPTFAKTCKARLDR